MIIIFAKLATNEEQEVQETIKNITQSKTEIEKYKKEIEKIKATISVYNELVSKYFLTDFHIEFHNYEKL